jgi:peptidyl-dipeptidase Dcp
MSSPFTISDISIRNELQPGDLGYVIHLHGALYKKEYNYGIPFEMYVAAGLHEFYHHYDPAKDRIWICEHHERIIGFLLLAHRPSNEAQLRYFLLEPAYRGIGLGKKLMTLFMDFYRSCGYTNCYLWTTHEQQAAADLYKKNGFRLNEQKESDAFGKGLIEQRYDLG